MSVTTSDDLSMRVQTLPGLREQVAERLRLAIATGKFPAGARLIERELCEMMGVSRTSLREALRELQADGLITLQPNDSVDRLSEVYSDFSAEAFIAAKTHFYDILLEGAGNPVAADMLRRIHTRVSQLRVVSLSSAERAQQSIRELREFLDALEKRDEELAGQVCVAHVEAAATAALKTIAAHKR
jgi:DNA-binding GntR family transcriptional regulator